MHPAEVWDGKIKNPRLLSKIVESTIESRGAEMSTRNYKDSEQQSGNSCIFVRFAIITMTKTRAEKSIKEITFIEFLSVLLRCMVGKSKVVILVHRNRKLFLGFGICVNPPAAVPLAALSAYDAVR